MATPGAPAAAAPSAARVSRAARDALPADQDAGTAPAAELERIARLRAEHRDREADRALDEFRRRYPDYRIPGDVWESVRPK